jgi:hypothetical protein
MYLMLALSQAPGWDKLPCQPTGQSRMQRVSRTRDNLVPLTTEFT